MCSLPLLENPILLEVTTQYGPTSAPVHIGKCQDAIIAFIPRHGIGHTIPPHKVPYKANLAALKSLGVREVIGTCVAGSLKQDIEPGTFIVFDQFINFTWGRDDTFQIDQKIVHLPMAEPYCQHLRQLISKELRDMRLQFRSSGTVVVIQGPRFSTVAESKMFAMWGGHVVNMTQYPECYFAKELGLCYAAFASVTDYDVGVPSAISMQTDGRKEVLEIFRRNIENTRTLIEQIARQCQISKICSCASQSLEAYY